MPAAASRLDSCTAWTAQPRGLTLAQAAACHKPCPHVHAPQNQATTNDIMSHASLGMTFDTQSEKGIAPFLAAAGVGRFTTARRQQGWGGAEGEAQQEWACSKAMAWAGQRQGIERVGAYLL